ncbi:MAG: DUF4197 domain-containing protein [Nitrospirota bacterium]
MIRLIFATAFILLMLFSPCKAGFLDNILKELGLSSEQGLDDTTAISGLKEALSIGTEKAVNEVSQIDGYLGNQAIKILMPEKIRKAADVLKKFGYQKQVDDFITSMNRAAEKAAPKAASHFVESIKKMTFEDARGILKGSNTAATDYFRSKTSEGLYNDFKPVISSSMDKVGVARLYKDMMGKYTSLPFMKELSFDLDRYITDKALAGLFHMVAQEEIKIRTDPAARVTDLLKKVFTK